MLPSGRRQGEGVRAGVGRAGSNMPLDVQAKQEGAGWPGRERPGSWRWNTMVDAPPSLLTSRCVQARTGHRLPGVVQPRLLLQMLMRRPRCHLGSTARKQQGQGNSGKLHRASQLCCHRGCMASRMQQCSSPGAAVGRWWHMSQASRYVFNFPPFVPNREIHRLYNTERCNPLLHAALLSVLQAFPVCTCNPAPQTYTD